MANYTGTDSANTYFGTAGADTIDGQGGNDRLSGRGGNDTITGGAGSDRIAGGAGLDTAVYTDNIRDLVVTTDDLGIWAVSTPDGDVDILTTVEQIRGAGGARILLVGEGGYDTIQEAINAAAASGDIIVVSGGTFDEDLVINKSVTIRGKQAGVDGADGRDAAEGGDETTLIGRHTITAEGAVTIDGVRFLNDASTSGGAPSNPTLLINSAFDHTVTNSIFYSEVNGGANGVDDRAIMMPVLGGGDITVSDNYFTGKFASGFGGASWGRAVWFDGGGADLTVTGNTIEFSRTGVNLDMTGDSTVTVSDNSFKTDGTAVSVAVDTVGLTLTNNDVQNVGTDFNFRNLTTAVTFDAEEAIGTVTPTVPPSSADFVVVLGGSGDDSIQGTAGADLLDGNNNPGALSAADSDTLEGRGGDDQLFGRFGNDDLSGGAGADTLDGGDGDDALAGGAGADTLKGGAGVDTASFAEGATIARNGAGAWTVTDADGVDTLTGVERVEIGDSVFLLVDKTGTGGFQSVQAAVNAAMDGDTILIAPGQYVETEEYVSGNFHGLYINTPNLTLQGVDANGAVINSAADAEDSAVIVSGAQNMFGANHWIDAGGDGVTLRGLHFKAGDETTNKLVEIWADNVTLEDSFVDTLYEDGTASWAAAVYINETAGEPINSFLIQDNVLNEGIYVANGVGNGDGDISATHQILNNHFETAGFDPADPDTMGRYDMVAVQGRIPGLGYQDDPAQVPTISGNTRSDNSAPFLFRMTEESANRFPTTAEVEALVAANTDAGTTYAYVLDGAGNPQLVEGGGINRYYVANGLDTLNRMLDSTADGVSGGTPRATMTAGDTVVLQNSGDETVRVDGLTIRATAASDGLTLTLGDTLVDGTDADVFTLSLADYALDMGAQVDVVGNALANTINGNSARNRLDGGGAGDTLNGAGGADVLDGGDGDDTLFGGNGSDVLLSSAGADAMDGGAGFDGVTYASGGAVTIFRSTGQAFGAAAGDTYVSVEQFVLSGEADGYVGGDFVDTVFGGAGDDDLDGRAGNDILRAQDGNDTVRGGSGQDILEGGAGNDEIDGGTGVDRASYIGATSAVSVNLASAAVQITGGAGNDTLISIEDVYGSTFNDNLRGSAGANALFGDDGNDVLRGNDGADVLTGGAGVDRFVYSLITDSDGADLDRITDMSAVDIIDLAGIDANRLATGNQAFTSRIAAGVDFSVGGQYRLVFDNGTTRLELNNDTDKEAETVILLTGDFTAVTATDGWVF